MQAAIWGETAGTDGGKVTRSCRTFPRVAVLAFFERLVPRRMMLKASCQIQHVLQGCTNMLYSQSIGSLRASTDLSKVDASKFVNGFETCTVDCMRI